MSFGDFFSGIGDDLSSFFGGSGSTPAATPDAAAPAITPDASGGGSFLSGLGNFFSPAASTGTSTGTIAPTGGGAAPAGPSTNISQFLSPSAPTSAAGGGIDTGLGNTDSVLSTAGQPAASAAPSTLQQITSALGLGGASTGDLLKGALGAGGLAYSVANNSGGNPALKQIEQQAGQAGAQGQQLEGYLANGTLPPGAQQYVDAQTASQKAAIRSRYAANGMSGSTAETQELNNVDTQATAQMFQIASQLYNTGVTQTGASSQLYDILMNAQNTSNEQIGSAISNFVSALGGGGEGKGTTIKVN